jgi:hypothetical protein
MVYSVCSQNLQRGGEVVEVGMERDCEIWSLVLTCIPNHEVYTLFGIISLNALVMMIINDQA